MTENIEKKERPKWVGPQAEEPRPDQPEEDQIISYEEIVINLLTQINQSLTDIKTNFAALKQPSRTTAAPQPVNKALSQVEDLQRRFPDLDVFETTVGISLKPKRFLGKATFSEIAADIKRMGGRYVSAGKDSHFEL